MNNGTPHSIPSLLKALRDETTTLLRQEVTLAKTELSEKVSVVVGNSVKLAIAGFVAYVGALVVLFALADLLAMLFVRAGVDADMATWLARAAVGLVVILVGWAMFVKAKKAISAENLVPEKTLQSVEENKEWAEAKLQHSP
ncbi:phage holin family protein [Opitutaceae bacterium EW11]|nr:phage holin family protein [Opitutaceae bacterium EW11]